MIKGAIFDLDGTLLDSMSVWDTIGERYLTSIGYGPRANINEVLKPMSLHEAALYFISEYGVRLSADEIAEGVNKTVEAFYFYEADTKLGVRDFLERSKQNGVKMCIATATDRYQAEAALVRLSIRDFFSEIFTCTEIGVGKSDPKIYRAALSHLQTARSDTVVFEDALYALRCAKADGFRCAAVYDVHEKEQDELKKAADFYIRSFEDADIDLIFGTEKEQK